MTRAFIGSLRIGGLVLALIGGVACYGERTEAPTLPESVTGSPPLRDEPTVVVGFAEPRVEIVEGEDAAILVAFEVPADSPHAGGLFYGLSLPVMVEGVTADGEDLQIGDGVWIRAPRGVPLRESTWLAMYAPLDGVAEGAETLKLRLSDPVFSGLGEPPAVEFGIREAEVVIRDRSSSSSGACSDVEIQAGTPQPVVLDEAEAYTTDVVVVTDTSQSAGLDEVPWGAAIVRWRLEISGSRVEHRFRVAWRSTCELRLRPCAAGEAGPTLVCSPRACSIYGPGEPVPPPEGLENCHLP